VSITNGFLTTPLMAFVGHFFEQALQPTHFSGMIVYFLKAAQTPEGHS
jgi:hypothetical protein